MKPQEIIQFVLRTQSISNKGRNSLELPILVSGLYYTAIFHASFFSESSEAPWYSCYLVVKLCPSLCNPMDCSPPDASVQARILE